MTAAKTKPGLRERKKLETRLAISDVATALFIERGFDRVTVAEVAEAANVSVNTIFNYFSTKEDLFFDRAEEVTDEPSRIVRERRPGESVISALHRGIHDAIHGKGLLFVTGKRIASFIRTIEGSPALKARERLFALEMEERLVRTLIEETNAKEDDPTARAVAAMVVGLMSMMARELRARMLGDEPPAKLRAALARLHERGFALLAAGVGDYGVKPKT